MKRRSFVRSGAGLLAGIGLAGCIGVGGSSSPPPRKSQVFSDVSLSGTTMQIGLLSSARVESRAESNGNALDGDVAASLAPVGKARAAKGAGGRGSGGYSSAPRGRHGWAVWHGGGYEDDWRDNHEDELDMYGASVATLGVAYLGSDNDYENNPPGPGQGAVNWDEQWSDPQGGNTLTADIASLSGGSNASEGWYRIGTELVSTDGDLDFGWQAADFEVDNELGDWTIDKAWHVKPRV